MMGSLDMWTVYHNPTDFPGKFVVRKWQVHSGAPHSTAVVHAADTLEEVRGHIPPGLFRQPRFDSDEPHIVEVWF